MMSGLFLIIFKPLVMVTGVTSSVLASSRPVSPAHAYARKHIQAAAAGAASGCTASRNPIALRMADKLLSAGLPFGESVR
jgi:hypothetical protein